MGHSRITLATLLALGLLGMVQADEAGREPFFVELKGPDDAAAPPVVQPQAQPAATTQSTPILRQPVASTQAGSYGPIRPTDTLWSLANKHRPTSRVSVYQTMVAIYDKNPRSFADGNINHILVGSHILLPSAAEASRITDAQARQRFNSDNASWKGLSPKYLASKQAQSAKPADTKVAAAPSPKAPELKASELKAAAPQASAPKAVPIPAAAPKAQPAVTEAAKAVAPSQAAATGAPAPLPAELATPVSTLVGKPATEMALALEDANAQLGQVTEMNHRLKLRLQSLTEEVETLKAQLRDQTALQKEVAELKARPMPPVVAPAPKPSWPMELLASPLNLAMIILLPVLLVLALVTLWLRARARRELEEQEKSLSESTAMVMGVESREFDPRMTVGIADEEPMRPLPDLNTPDGHRAMEESSDIVFRDDSEQALPASDMAPVAAAASRAPDLVPELDLAHEGSFDLSSGPGRDLAGELDPFAHAGDEPMIEEERQTALFAEPDADLTADLTLVQGSTVTGASRDEALAGFDLSDVDPAFNALADKVQRDGYGKANVDEMLAELGLGPVQAKGAATELAWDPGELALADFEDAFAEVEPHPEATPRLAVVAPREQAPVHDYVEIDKLLAEANASSTEQEPYQGFSLDVGLDGFPEVLPQSTGFDVDADDGGVGAKLDLARAYLEIDDRESARELLQEAVAQGSDHQRTEAEKLLRRLA